MSFSKSRQFYVIFCTLLVHRSSCQQSSSYSPPGQTKLEDIERDNLKNAQPQSAVPQTSAQYVAQQDQQLLYQYPAQQAGQLLQPSVQQQTATANASPLLNVAGQPAYFGGGGQQPFFYYPAAAHTSQPVVDFSSIFPANYPPPFVPTATYQTGGVVKSNAAAPIASAPVRTATVPQFANPYFLPAAAVQQPFYQPFAFGQSPQYYYNNALYQTQIPQKSLFSVGVKSTTPAAPIKGRDESFVPIGAASSYYPAPNPDPYAKLRLTTG